MSQSNEAQLTISGMNCNGCATRVLRAISDVPGVESCQVDLAGRRAAIRFDPHATTPQTIADAVARAGYQAAVQGHSARKSS